mmetsp:Transcript_13121/g.14198  ORF Transcript_13121/g.14198 Transcript_13121/m.14198 type:complete len:340 (+) Transcript_13121:181-1200(+)|eukprot:CAMPEP_0173155090 /NCGR_PEP_ID=MMETSP1105-20130129/13890_1 /TAXON_ID=2985 /ORGANISM="Ochromonas sp., Strain BG-1" /LENGTH=339 /DNA_ID=CAMNT_0014071433 /DNA_START=148 /DNA_END=1167 /DNA_ORIENTATION=+
MDTTEIVALILFLIIWGAYFLIIVIQYFQSTAETERIVTYNVRTAFFLPAYALMLFITVFKPYAFAGLNIFITFMEGYSFYCFFTMLVYNLGGPVKAVEAYNKVERELACCRGCCPSDGLAFYKRIRWALFHFVFTRTVVSIAAALATLAHNERVARALGALFSVINVVILFSCLIHILLFYEKMFESSSNLFGILKAFLLKFSVGLIVLQGLVVSFMAVTHSQPYNGDDEWSAARKTMRGYAVLVLIEYTFLSPAYLYAFGIYKITFQPDSPAAISSKTNSTTGEAPTRSNICKFFFDVINVFDSFGYLDYPEDSLEYSKVVSVDPSQKKQTVTPSSQ